MFIFYIYFVLCGSRAKLEILEFNETQSYHSFRDNFAQNSFLITLVIKNTKKYQFYKDFFGDISNDTLRYVNKHINFSFSILVDSNYSCKYDATFIIYIPGIPEQELSIYPRLSVAFNTNRIYYKCLGQAVALRRFEKAQKSPEIARIKSELRGIARILKSQRDLEDAQREKLLNDYAILTNELMQYISENKQKEKRIKLQLQLQRNGSPEYKKLVKELEKCRKENKKKFSQKDEELSPKQLEKLAEKNMINSLRESSSKTDFGIVTSACGTVYRYAKSGITSLWNSATKKKHQVDDL